MSNSGYITSRNVKVHFDIPYRKFSQKGQKLLKATPGLI